MTTFADWTRGILEAADERGWAVIRVDAREGSVILEEPVGSGGLTIILRGRTLDANFVRALPEAARPREPGT